MSGLFLTGRIATLIDRLTATRAAALDLITSTRMNRLDTNVASRQSESNALARYNALDALIDGAIADIGDIPTSMIKSRQTVLYSAGSGDQDVTISAVNTAKCLLSQYGTIGISTTSAAYAGTGARITLTSSTNMHVDVTGSFTGIIDVTILEFY